MNVAREFVSRLKRYSSQAYKIYKAVVYSERELETEDLKSLEAFFENRIIQQRTPTRVLRRKPDRIRNKKVYKVRIYRLTPHIFVALIKCEGGLYVKELIT